MRRLGFLGLLLAWSTLASAQPAAPPANTSASLTTAVCPGTGCVTLRVSGYASLGIQVTGTWTGTLTFQGSLDAVTYQSLTCSSVTTGTSSTTTTANGVFTCNVGGLATAQVSFTAPTGTAVVSLQSALSGGGSGGGGGGGAASSVTINDPSVTTQKAAVNASGQLSITCANCSGSGASAVDNSVFTAGTTSGAPAMGFYHSTIDTVTDGDTAAVAMDSKRSTFGVIRDAALNARGANVTAANALVVDGSAATQPVSAVALPLPTNAATSALQTTGNTSVGSIDTKIPALGQALAAASVPIVLTAAQLTTLTPLATVTANAGTNLNTSALALEAGHLATIDTSTAKIPAQGQALAGASMPVVLTAAQITTLTPLATVAVTSAGLTNLDVALSTRTKPADQQHTIVDSGTLTAVTAITNALPAGANVIGHVINDTGSTTAVTGNVTVVQPTGTNLHAVIDATSTTAVTQATGTNLHAVLDATSTTAVTQAAAANLNATVVGTGTFVVQATDNVTQFGGTNISTGAGAGGAGIPRVTVSNDSTVTANAGTNLNTSALALSATQTDGTQKTKIVDGSGNVIAATANALNVQCANCSGSGASAVDQATFTAGSSVFAPMGGEFNDSAAALASGTQGMARLTANRAEHVNLRDGLGQELGVRTNPEYVSDLVLAQLLARIQSQGTRLSGTFGRAISSSGDALDVNLRYADPCSGSAKASVPISQTTNTRLLAGPSRKVFICSIMVVGADAENLALVQGTGTTCGTGTVGVIGGATAATGPNMAANGGFSMAGGNGAIAISDGVDICLLQSGVGRVAGVLTYALQQN